MNSLIAVTKWIETSSSEDFLLNFKSLGDNYSGITLAEYLEEVARNVAIEANNVAKIAKRKTIKPEDIKLAIKNLE